MMLKYYENKNKFKKLKKYLKNKKFFPKSFLKNKIPHTILKCVGFLKVEKSF